MECFQISVVPTVLEGTVASDRTTTPQVHSGKSFVRSENYCTGTVDGKQNYSTQYSRVVPHHSTDCAITSLTSEIRRDPVLSGVYGRSWEQRAPTPCEV